MWAVALAVVQADAIERERRARLAALGIGLGRDDLGRPRSPVRVVPPRLNCINCGAPHEPARCSYCLTPHP